MILKKTYKEVLVNRSGPIKTMLFTNARDEKNMKEWCAHHLLLGFDYICIFDHKSQIPLQHEFKNFNKRVSIIRCEWPNPVKDPLMKQSINIAKQLNIDWLLYLDADEFLVLNAYQNIKHMLTIFKNADSLAINWLMFGSNNHKKEPSGTIIENYTKSDLLLNKHVKSFVRPSQVTNISNPHFFHIRNPDRRVSMQYNVMNQQHPEFNELPIEYTKSNAYIAHYLNQSEETYINRKLNLPRDDVNAFRNKEENIHQYHNDVDNLSLVNKYLDNINNFLSSSTTSSATTSSTTSFSTTSSASTI
jgi:hypothetical protein